MGKQADFKIRTLPRKDEARRPTPALPSPRPKWPLVAGVVAALLLLAYALAREVPTPARELSSQQPVRDPMLKRLDGYVADVRMKEEILRQRRELENLRTKTPDVPLDLASTAPEVMRPLGVTLDVENTADRLYHELNDRPTLNVDQLPESRINARLEKNKWVNELDRQERIQFIRNFVKSAYDRGYEVDIDQNLVVVGVRPIMNRTISLEQVIDRVSKQGL